MKPYNNDSTMMDLKAVLEGMSKEDVITELLDAYWAHPKSMSHSKSFDKMIANHAKAIAQEAHDKLTK